MLAGAVQSILMSPGLGPWLKASVAGPAVVCACARTAAVAGDSPTPVARARSWTLYHMPTVRFSMVYDVPLPAVAQEPYVAVDSSLYRYW